MTEMRPFLCDSIDKSLLRSEWEKWLRSFTLYLQSEDIKDASKQKHKLLHLGGPQLQEVIFNIPGALVEADAENKVDVFKVLVENMNKSLVKRLKIAHANRTNYKEAIQKFILMYNVTPHSTTGAAPTELMFNRVIRDKIPGIHDITDDMLDSAARDLDIMNKQKGKEKGDMARRAKPSDIAPGDKVLLRNVVFSHKLTPTFDPTEYEVLDRVGNEVIVMADGKRVRRNISHVKKLPYSTPHNFDGDTTAFERTAPSTAHGTSLLSAASTSASSKNGPSGTPNDLATNRPGIDTPADESKLRLKLYKEGGMWRSVNGNEI